MSMLHHSYLRCLELEGTHPNDAGSWQVTILRLQSGEGIASYGDRRSGIDHPPDTPLPPAPKVPDSVPRLPQPLFYRRIRSLPEVERFVQRVSATGFSLEIFTSWADPPGGIIPMPSPDEVPYEHTHYVSVIKCDAMTRSFTFQVRWRGWGDDSKGYLPYDYFDRFVFECWGAYTSTEPETRRVKTVEGTKEISWIARDDWGHRVFGCEIKNKSLSNRRAWAFVVERDGALEIEEIYVRPEFRRRGYANRLILGIQAAAAEERLPLRLWVPFADCKLMSPNTYPALVALVKKLGLRFQPCPFRWAAYYATNERPGSELPIEPAWIPPRPRCPSNDLKAAANATKPWQFTVWFATNRATIGATNNPVGFSGDRSDGVHYGKCVVTVPRSHRFGSIGSNWFDRWRRGADDRLNLESIACLADQAFWDEIRTTLNERPHDERQSLVFLHGFNVSFEEAAIRAAQIGFDLKVPGVTAFFSWPSKCSIGHYPADEAAIEASEAAITNFLARFATDTGSETVHLIAHSMGNRGLLRSLHHIALQAEQASNVRFGQIFVLAPDIDVGLFRNLANVYCRCSERTTLYASSGDIAVRASGFVHDYPRAGFIPPVTIVPGVDTVEVPKFNLLDLGHAYYAEAAPVLHDMFDLIRHGEPPRNRQRLVEMASETGETYWRIMA